MYGVKSECHSITNTDIEVKIIESIGMYDIHKMYTQQLLLATETYSYGLFNSYTKSNILEATVKESNKYFDVYNLLVKNDRCWESIFSRSLRHHKVISGNFLFPCKWFNFIYLFSFASFSTWKDLIMSGRWKSEKNVWYTSTKGVEKFLLP